MLDFSEVFPNINTGLRDCQTLSADFVFRVKAIHDCNGFTCGSKASNVISGPDQDICRKTYTVAKPERSLSHYTFCATMISRSTMREAAEALVSGYPFANCNPDCAVGRLLYGTWIGPTAGLVRTHSSNESARMLT